MFYTRFVQTLYLHLWKTSFIRNMCYKIDQYCNRHIGHINIELNWPQWDNTNDRADSGTYWHSNAVVHSHVANLFTLLCIYFSFIWVRSISQYVFTYTKWIIGEISWLRHDRFSFHCVAFLTSYHCFWNYDFHCAHIFRNWMNSRIISSIFFLL